MRLFRAFREPHSTLRCLLCQAYQLLDPSDGGWASQSTFTPVELRHVACGTKVAGAVDVGRVYGLPLARYGISSLLAGYVVLIRRVLRQLCKSNSGTAIERPTGSRHSEVC